MMRNRVAVIAAMHTVLYVDDEPADLEIGRIFLERDGQLRVETCSSAAAALVALREQPYDAIVSDFQMPAMDGISFLKAVRSEFGDIPFLLLTGRGREEVAIAAINNGADRYIQKGGNPAVQYAELAHGIGQAVLRRETERTLRLSEERFRRLFEQIPVGIAVVGRDLRFRMVNPALCRMLGYAEEELIGQPFASVTDPGDVPLSLAETARVIDGEVAFVRIEKRYLRKDGALVRGRVTISAIRDDQGGVEHLLPVIEELGEDGDGLLPR
jgi:PAS domain S-box-containing protein